MAPEPLGSGIAYVSNRAPVVTLAITIHSLGRMSAASRRAASMPQEPSYWTADLVTTAFVIFDLQNWRCTAADYSEEPAHHSRRAQVNGRSPREFVTATRAR